MPNAFSLLCLLKFLHMLFASGFPTSTTIFLARQLLFLLLSLCQLLNTPDSLLQTASSRMWLEKQNTKMLNNKLFLSGALELPPHHQLFFKWMSFSRAILIAPWGGGTWSFCFVNFSRICSHHHMYELMAGMCVCVCSTHSSSYLLFKDKEKGLILNCTICCLDSLRSYLI